MLEDKNTTSIESVGEFGLIDLITAGLTPTQASTIKGIGDDAAVIKTENGKCMLVSTDLLLEGVHFDLSYMPLKHLGFKAITVNVSDIYAMNGKPTHVTVSLGISSKFSVDAIEEIYQGIQLAAKHYGIDIIGGDTSTSKQGLLISVTVMGEAAIDDVVYRSGAKDNDLICVSGDLGAAYMGYQILEREKRVYLSNPEIQPDLEGHDYILERQLKPEARKDLIETLKGLSVKPTAMIDISDGLSSELMHIAKQSDVGIVIYEEKIPIDTTTYNMAREMELDPTMCALNGGEDYELLFTISQADYDKVKNNADISIIGHCVNNSEGISLITKSNNKHELKAQGWKAF
jgi:thiamine-monophosphate kinase